MGSQNLDIRQVDWGSDAAESDPNLLEYFVDPHDFLRLKTQRKQFVVGRKGAGKSAIRRKLVDEIGEEKNVVAIEILPAHSVFRSMSADADLSKNFAEEIFFQYAWLFHFYEKALDAIGTTSTGKLTVGSYVAARDFALARGTANRDFLEGVRNLINGIKVKGGNNLGELGLTIESTLRTVSGIESMQFHVQKLAQDGAKIVFLVDDLDLGWDNSELSNKALQGLLLASHYIRSLHPNLNCIIFIRDDMYRVVLQRTQHSDKFREQTTLRWDTDKLKAVLDARIRFNYQQRGIQEPEDTFHSVFPDQVGTTGTMNWMAERTLGRPRELIQLAKLYTENLTLAQPDSETLKSIEERYSTQKLQDLSTEYQNQYPGLKLVFDRWRAKFFRNKYHHSKAELDEILLDVISEVDIQYPWFQQLKTSTDVPRTKKNSI